MHRCLLAELIGPQRSFLTACAPKLVGESSDAFRDYVFVTFLALNGLECLGPFFVHIHIECQMWKAISSILASTNLSFCMFYCICYFACFFSSRGTNIDRGCN